MEPELVALVMASQPTPLTYSTLEIRPYLKAY